MTGSKSEPEQAEGRRHTLQDLLTLFALQVLQHNTNTVGALVLNILWPQLQEAVGPSHREQGRHEGEDEDKVHLGGGCSIQLPQDRHREGRRLLIWFKATLKA